VEDLIAEESIVVTLTNHGYIKRLPADTYKAQHRGGRGITGATTKEEDFIETLFITTTHTHILFCSPADVRMCTPGKMVCRDNSSALGK